MFCAHDSTPMPKFRPTPAATRYAYKLYKVACKFWAAEGSHRTLQRWSAQHGAPGAYVGVESWLSCTWAMLWSASARTRKGSGVRLNFFSQRYHHLRGLRQTKTPVINPLISRFIARFKRPRFLSRALSVTGFEKIAPTSQFWPWKSAF